MVATVHSCRSAETGKAPMKAMKAASAAMKAAPKAMKANIKTPFAKPKAMKAMKALKREPSDGLLGQHAVGCI